MADHPHQFTPITLAGKLGPETHVLGDMVAARTAAMVIFEARKLLLSLNLLSAGRLRRCCFPDRTPSGWCN